MSINDVERWDVTKMQKADIRERLRRKAGDPGWPNDEREQVIQDTRTLVKGKVYVREAKREIQTHRSYRYHGLCLYVHRRNLNENRNCVYLNQRFSYTN